MKRIKFSLLAALAVVAFNGISCDGGGSPVLSDTEQTRDLHPNGEEPSSPDDSSDNAIGEKTLIGTRWKLFEVSLRVDYKRTEVFDYLERGIVFEFQGNNRLIITGNTSGLIVFSDEFKNGEHFYEYSGEFVGCPLCMPGPNLSIDNPNMGDPQLADLGKRYYLNLYDTSMTVHDNVYRKVTEETGLSGGGENYFWSSNFIKLK